MSYAGERGELRDSLGNESEKCDVAREKSVSPSSISKRIVEVEASEQDTITEIRLFNNLPKNKWKYIHRILGNYIFEEK